jgi:uncharacterized protein YecE (DUF72 family)
VGRLYAGTSGFAYPDWAPLFYPSGTRAEALLPFYAGTFRAVELNNTFYARPTEAKVRSWLAATPSEFRFSVKGQRGATLRALQQGAPDSVAWLVESLRPFGERLGTVLYRVPADVRRDDERLGALLGNWPADIPLTMEFQDPSWLVDEVLDPLRSRGVALCATDLDELAEPPSLHLTAPYLYLRLRRTDYDDAGIAAWAARIQPFLDAGHDAYVFFKHDAVGNATRLASALIAATDRLRVSAAADAGHGPAREPA